MTGERRRALGILLTLALAFAGFFAVKHAMFENFGNYVVTAEFRDAGGLRKNSDVKIGGVPAGKIKSLTLSGHDTALVTMALDREAAPIGAGANAEVRPVNLLGEKYVDLSPGDLRRPASSGSRIPLARTGVSVELDDVLNMLDSDTRARLRIIVNEFGAAVAGRGADFNALLESMPPALDSTRALVAQLGADNGRLKQLLVSGDRVVADVASKRGDLQRLVDSAGRALAVTAGRRERLGATLREAAPTLRQLRTTLASLGATSQQLAPAARALRGAAPALAQTLARVPAFAAAASPTLAVARSVAPTLASLGSRGAPVVRRLAPVAAQLGDFSGRLDPLTRTLDDNSVPLLGTAEGWARTISTRDRLGHLFRTSAVLDRELIGSLVQRYGGPAREHRRPVKHAPVAGPGGAAGPAIQRPALPKLPRVPLPAVNPPAVKPPRVKPADSADLQNVVDFLLG